MLKPRYLVQAALQDLAIAQQNRAVRADKRTYKSVGANGRYAGSVRQTAFLGRHLRDAKTAADVLREAIADRLSGTKSSKPEQRIIYSDELVLIAALSIAEKEGL